MSVEHESRPIDGLADSVDPRVVDQYSLTPLEAAALVSARGPSESVLARGLSLLYLVVANHPPLLFSTPNHVTQH